MPRPRIEDAEDRLLAAGLNLFARRGTERVNTNTIAKRARLAIGTFYAHFPDKHALLREIQMRTIGALRTARVEATRGAGTNPEDQVRASARAARLRKSVSVAYGLWRATVHRQQRRRIVLSRSTRTCRTIRCGCIVCSGCSQHAQA